MTIVCGSYPIVCGSYPSVCGSYPIVCVVYEALLTLSIFHVTWQEERLGRR